MSIVPLALLAFCAPLRPAQTHASAPPPAPGIVAGNLGDIRWSVPGMVVDLARDSAGRILYCTAEREVGRLEAAGRTVLATAASFPNALTAVAESGADVVVLDVLGHVRRLPGGVPPAVVVYLDQFMIAAPTDLIVDARGSFLTASATPTSGVRALNWIQADGVDWSYYLVRHQPLAIAHDPLTGGILMSETSGGGSLRLVQAGSPVRATLALDTSTQPGLGVAQSDGDLAVEASGNLYWIAGGTVRHHVRGSGTSTTVVSGLGPLRGAVIAATAPLSHLPGPWSLYVAEGASPTRVREVLASGAPAAVVASDQGDPPGRGLHVPVTYNSRCLDLTLGQGGQLLMGGMTFGTDQFLMRITTTGTPSITTLASDTDGLIGPVEGVSFAPDQSIYTLARDGRIQRITTTPLTVTTVFDDPGGDIQVAKDLALDVDGSFYVACRDATDFGRIVKVALGSVTLLLPTEETRGLAARPLGGMYFSQWRSGGFEGTVDLLHFTGPTVETLPGFDTLNFSNDEVRGDGEIVVDALGNLYTICEDEWSLVRYDANLDGIERIGSGYLGRPAGLALAPSTDASGSTTGWSLFVSESLDLWEHPSFPPPASPWVDATLGLTIERTLAGAPHPRFGRPSALAPAPAGLLVGTEEGWLLSLDARTGALEPVAGPEEQAGTAILALATAPDGRRTLALDARGALRELRAGGLVPLAIDPARSAALVARYRAAPQDRACLVEARSGAGTWFALDGWAVWRVPGR